MMLVLGVLSLIGSFAAVLWSLGMIGVSHKAVRRRLVPAGGPEMPDESTLKIAKTTNKRIGFLVPSRKLQAYERTLQLGGRPYGWTPATVVRLKIVLTLVLSGGFFFLLVLPAPGMMKIAMWIAITVMAFIVPDTVIAGRATERQAAIELALPDVLDQVTIAIESGMGFEAALTRVGLAGEGPLADELVRTVQDMRLGMPRREAYGALAGRTEVEDLHRFLRTIVQAEENGVSVASVVRGLAKEMRVNRRLRAEGRAQQVPTKMLFPMMACIFPVLFVIVLAPAVFNIADTFAGR
jgi:tight adherence protein C|nr:secretion system protein [Aeromicrobium sp.]